jgi:hypothetical protein
MLRSPHPIPQAPPPHAGTGEPGAGPTTARREQVARSTSRLTLAEILLRLWRVERVLAYQVPLTQGAVAIGHRERVRPTQGGTVVGPV